MDPAYADKIEWRHPLEQQEGEAANAQKAAAGGKKEGKDAKGKKGQASSEKRPPVRRWPRGPVKWIERGDGDLDLMAVGSEKGKLRREVVATMRLGGAVGGSADPTGPLRQRSALEGPARGAREEQRAVNGEGVGSGLTTAAAAAAAPGESAPKAEVDGGGSSLAAETGALSLDSDQQQEQQQQQQPPIENGGLANGESAAAPSASAAKDAIASALPAVEPVPLDAMATALPGEGGKEETKERNGEL